MGLDYLLGGRSGCLGRDNGIGGSRDGRDINPGWGRLGVTYWQAGQLGQVGRGGFIRLDMGYS